MKTVLFAQPSFQPPGGGNGLAAWMLEALKSDYQVTTISWQPLDLSAINRYWGTALQPGDVETLTSPGWLRVICNVIPLRLGLLTNSLFMRFVRPLTQNFDLVITANNEMDFGRPGVQYVHYPGYHRPRPAVDLRWYHQPRFILTLYYRICDRISQIDVEALRDNLTLVNSNWTGEIFRKQYDQEPRTLYPPVTGAFPEVSWDQRRNGFVCLGRISPEKDIGMIIDIVAQVRRVHLDVELHIVGSPDNRSYFRQIVRKIADHRDWITLHADLSYDEVRKIIGANRYGIHAMENEHFGMAPAEMATGGCIVWVRDDGGQVEIVNGEPTLIFHSPQDAVHKILQTMEDANEQTRLRTILAEQAPNFSVERFIDGVKAAAREQLDRQKSL
jgi:glycosyltransferase involved in cell wall biosynthesis